METLTAKTSSNTLEKARKLRMPDIKTYYKVTVIQTVW